MTVQLLLDSEVGRDGLERLCEPEALSSPIARALVDAVRERAGQARRRGLFDAFDAILADDE
ncbi:hypothetical protein [Brevundimonas sp.]|uniref:hypothetical protein n=1 Tax=Brevundimonas sp. TaxID=1871086 RepID=UPI003F6EE653